MSASPFRHKLGALLDRIDALAQGLGNAVVGWGAWSAVLGVGLGSGSLHALRELSWLGPVSTAVQAFVALGGVLLVLVTIGALSYRRHGSIRWKALADAAQWFNPRFAWLVAPRLLFALGRSIEDTEPLKVLTFGVVCAIAVGISAYHWAFADVRSEHASASEEVNPRDGTRWTNWATGFALAGLFTGYTAIFTRLSWNNLWGFNMARSDMGYYVSIFRHSSQGVPLGMSLSASGNHLSGHFDPILVLLSPIYLLYPHAETILLLQAAWLGSGIFPVFLLSRHFGCGLIGAALLCICYTLYPALHGINLFDFHSIALAVPVIMWLLLFFEQGRKKSFFVTFLLLLLVREDMALLSCFIGFYALVSGKTQGPRWGWIVIGSALLWLIVVKGFIMTRSDLLMAADSIPSSGGSSTGRAKPSGYTQFYAELLPKGGNTRALIATLVGKPVRVLNTILKEEKIIYFVQILLPLSCLPLFAPTRRLLLLYGFAFTLLASRPHLHSLHFQYSSVLVPFVFPLSAAVLGSLRRHSTGAWLPVDRRRLYVALLGSTLTLTTICSWKFGAIISNQTFSAGFRPLVRKPSSSQLRLAAWLKTVCPTLPEGATVATNSRMLAHLGNCDKIVLPQHRKRADFLIYRPTTDPLTKKIASEAKRGYLEEVDRHDKIVLYKTRYDRAKKKRTKKRAKKSTTKRAKKSTTKRAKTSTRTEPKTETKRRPKPAPKDAGKAERRFKPGSDATTP